MGRPLFAAVFPAFFLGALPALLLGGCAAGSRIDGGLRARPAACSLSGTVRDGQGPVPGAVVRIQGGSRAVTSDADGRFRFTGLSCAVPVPLTAWARGYYIGGGTPFRPGTTEVEILLLPHTDRDNFAYAWLPSGYFPGQGENQGCTECHSSDRGGVPELEGLLPVDEWRRDAHGLSARNPRFLSMYLGTDLDGRRSPPTRLVQNRDYGPVPLPPDPEHPYYGPGYKLDFPESDGNCGSCHIPLAAAGSAYGVNPEQLSAAEQEGVSCDFCHKIWDVRLGEDGLPATGRPGVLSIELRRPEEGHQLFMGPFDDVAPGEDTYLPLQRRSQFCAPCHFGVFWDAQIYNSYGEWLDSPYSDPATGKTCQDCHMPKRGVRYFVRPDKGGLKRDPSRISSHLMPGALDRELLQNALTMEVRVDRGPGSAGVEVELFNDQTGHHVPTDSPLRHLILRVRLTGRGGRELPLLEGPVLPDWAGGYAGQAGKVYAKVLEELWTEVAPSGAYWNQTRVLSDNRLPAFGRDRSRYLFQADGGQELELQVELLYRRAFQELMDLKGWPVEDILMERYRRRLEAATE
jgi:hypothetical protein